MKGYCQLQALGKPYDNDMSINLINRSLNKDFCDFVKNFNMHCVGKTVSDLHALLINYEKGLKDKAPTPQVLAIQKGRVNKPKPQANKKGKGKSKADKNKQLVTGRGTALFTSKSWAKIRTRRLSTVLQLQGFRVKRKLSYGEQYLHVGNGAQAVVEAIGVFNLVLPSGLVLSLNSCYYAPSIIRGVVFFSCLLDLGFVHTVTSNGISVSLNGIFYFSAISVNGVFEIDMNDNVSKNNNNSIFSINKKRKLDLNSSYLWHCRLAHIGKTRMQKLQQVELQLGKKIKALRSDRGGEYLSQEFKDYLSENGIVQNLTSPYTPQQNGVSERRNRTLLDMVRSMFNLTTLPLSFWDYALESAVRILNMVPNKKVDKTPYEKWHGKAPNLSYLKVWGCEAYVKRDSADKLETQN
ncbi:retrotransposon protein, putative, ty1-copia subclass [Tanacetum coccineum]